MTVAQFIAICRSAKTCAIGENLLSVADPISRLQERRSHVGACLRPPPLQRRPVSGLHAYAAMERSAPPVSPVPEPGRRSLGAVPLPPRLQTLLVSRLPAHLQRSHRDPLAPEQEAAVVLDTRHLPGVPIVLVATDCSGVRGPYPDELSLALVAAEYGRLLRNRSPAGRHRGSGCPLPYGGTPGASAARWEEGVGTPRAWAPQETRARSGP